MSDRVSPGQDLDIRREFLFAAIGDTEDTIRAADVKASIALVVHGFIFSTVVATARESLRADFSTSSSCFRVAVVVLLAAVGATFLVSILQLIRCVRPAPERAIPKVPDGRGLFFLPGAVDARTGKLSDTLSPSTLADEVALLNPSAIERELTGELLKVSAIRARKTALVGNGLAWLAVEAVLALGFLTVLGLDAL